MGGGLRAVRGSGKGGVSDYRKKRVSEVHNNTYPRSTALGWAGKEKSDRGQQINEVDIQDPQKKSVTSSPAPYSLHTTLRFFK